MGFSRPATLSWIKQKMAGWLNGYQLLVVIKNLIVCFYFCTIFYFIFFVAAVELKKPLTEHTYQMLLLHYLTLPPMSLISALFYSFLF